MQGKQAQGGLYALADAKGAGGRDNALMPRLKTAGGDVVELPIPSEYKIRNEANKRQHKKDTIYSVNEVRSMHVHYGDKAALVGAIQSSSFGPKKSQLIRVSHGYFPSGGYDDDTIRAFLQPYSVGSPAWHAQVNKIAQLDSHGRSVRDVCNMYGGEWVFKRGSGLEISLLEVYGGREAVVTPTNGDGETSNIAEGTSNIVTPTHGDGGASNSFQHSRRDFQHSRSGSN